MTTLLHVGVYRTIWDIPYDSHWPHIYIPDPSAPIRPRYLCSPSARSRHQKPPITAIPPAHCEYIHSLIHCDHRASYSLGYRRQHLRTETPSSPHIPSLRPFLLPPTFPTFPTFPSASLHDDDGPYPHPCALDAPNHPTSPLHSRLCCHSHPQPDGEPGSVVHVSVFSLLPRPHRRKPAPAPAPARRRGRALHRGAISRPRPRPARPPRGCRDLF